MRVPCTMRAWRVEALTDEGTMHRREIDRPVPGPDEHLLRVEAAGVAFGDTLLVRGRYQVKPPLPFTPGSDVVGCIAGNDGTLTPLPASRLLLHNASAIGVLWGEVRKRVPALSAQLTQEIVAAWRAGELPLPPGRAFAFDEAPQALAALAGRNSIGKIRLDLQALR